MMKIGMAFYCCPADNLECTNEYSAWTDVKAARIGGVHNGVGLPPPIRECAKWFCEEMSVPMTAKAESYSVKRNQCDKSIYCSMQSGLFQAGHPCCAIGGEQECGGKLGAAQIMSPESKKMCTSRGFDSTDKHAKALTANVDANNKKCLRYFCRSLLKQKAGKDKCVAHPHCVWSKAKVEVPGVGPIGFVKIISGPLEKIGIHTRNTCCGEGNDCGKFDDEVINWDDWKSQEVCSTCTKCVETLADEAPKKASNEGRTSNQNQGSIKCTGCNEEGAACRKDSKCLQLPLGCVGGTQCTCAKKNFLSTKHICKVSS